ncbi:MAG: UbiX family flavin prenyltransferase [Nitrospirae bacterium]|nr:UbiX family flavin prenyltransferase [Nitrospirota bacterium]
MKKYVFAISGASGSIIGIRVLKELIKHSEIHLVISSQSFSIIKEETGIDFSVNKSSQFTFHGSQSWKRSEIQKADTAIERKIRDYFKSRQIHYHSEYDLAAPVSSGSFKTDGMLVVPCSMKTLSGIANGYANNLIERAADVTIKEGRALLLSPREMPFSAIHLENMLKLSSIGVKIAPPVLAFYHKPKKIEDIVDFIAGKILDAVGVEHEIYKRWGTAGSKQ